MRETLFSILRIICHTCWLCDSSYGAVYKGVHKETAEEVAIKIIPAEEDMTQLELEIDFLRRLKSPYVVSFIEGYLFELELWVSRNAQFYLFLDILFVDRNGILCCWLTE